MRPKIVELTGAKLDLAEKVESLKHTVRSRDTFISQLENDLGEAREETERIEKAWKENLAEQEKRHREIQNGTTDIQIFRRGTRSSRRSSIRPLSACVPWRSSGQI
ncbi:hypothetical protein HYPSUDRAFT_1094472, partial [Hypholoma sublateritium FD-334 SS-4]